MPHLPKFIPTALCITTFIAFKQGFQLTTGWTNGVWLSMLVFSALVVHLSTRAQYPGWIRYGVLLAELGLCFYMGDAIHSKSTVYFNEDGSKVEGYWQATGFMDAGTVFEVFQKVKGFPLLEKRKGYAVNWQLDYLSGMSQPTILLSPEAVWVVMHDRTDTLLIRPKKYFGY